MSELCVADRFLQLNEYNKQNNKKILCVTDELLNCTNANDYRKFITRFMDKCLENPYLLTCNATHDTTLTEYEDKIPNSGVKNFIMDEMSLVMI